MGLKKYKLGELMELYRPDEDADAARERITEDAGRGVSGYWL